MNEKAKAELIRQLVEGVHFFRECLECKERFAGEEPFDRCPVCKGPCKTDRDQAERHYREVIDHAIEWGNKP